MAVLRVVGTDPGRMPRSFSACAIPSLERRVVSDLSRCVEAIRARLPRSMLTGIVLGGGYGRGEGGVRMTPAPVPYNDYDLFVITPTLPRPLALCVRATLGRLAEQLTDELDVEVEIAPLDLRNIERAPNTLAMADLRWRHRVLWGPADVLGRMPGPMLCEVPPVEAVRLIMNRTALLVMAHDMATALDANSPEVAERILRYVSKAWMASGDARLIASGRYHPSWFRRLARLEADDEGPLALGPMLKARYREVARERLEGAPNRLPGNPADAVRKAAGALRGSLDVVEQLRVGQGTSDHAAYREVVLAATPASWKDRVRDLRDGIASGQPTHTLKEIGSRASRTYAELPDILDTLSSRDATDRIRRIGPPFLRRWRSLP